MFFTLILIFGAFVFGFLVGTGLVDVDTIRDIFTINTTIETDDIDFQVVDYIKFKSINDIFGGK